MTVSNFSYDTKRMSSSCSGSLQHTLSLVVDATVVNYLAAFVQRPDLDYFHPGSFNTVRTLKYGRSLISSPEAG